MKHISDIKKFEHCDKLLWMSKRYPKPYRSLVTYNENCIALSLKKLQVDTYFEGKSFDSNDCFIGQVNNFKVFINVRLEYHGLRIKVPILMKEEKGFVVYYPYASCYPKESELQMMADHKWVFDNLQIPVIKRFITYLDAQYIRTDGLDVDALIKVGTHLFNDRNSQTIDIQENIVKYERNLDPILQKIDITLQKEYITKEQTSVCSRRNKCPYIEDCFEHRDDTSILHLVSSAHKYSLYKQGYQHIEDIDFDQIEGTKHQYAQYYAATFKQLFFDTYGVQAYLEDITHPISYLDFEWETFAFPPYAKMHPYDVVCFQYSLHIESSTNQLKHYDFFGKGDCREAFIQSLLQHIPKQGTILCYNVEGAEKLRLKQLAIQFPAYEAQLKQIWERMLDLSIPFAHGLIYDNRMRGMYSLKQIVSIFTDQSYAHLAVNDGLDAVRMYTSLEDNDQDGIDSLRAYCAMDTYAMYLIYHWILARIQEYA